MKRVPVTLIIDSNSNIISDDIRKIILSFCNIIIDIPYVDVCILDNNSVLLDYEKTKNLSYPLDETVISEWYSRKAIKEACSFHHGVVTAISLLNERLTYYRNEGIQYETPCIFLLSDMTNSTWNDSTEASINKLQNDGVYCYPYLLENGTVNTDSDTSINWPFWKDAGNWEVDFIVSQIKGEYSRASKDSEQSDNEKNKIESKTIPHDASNLVNDGFEIFKRYLEYATTLQNILSINGFTWNHEWKSPESIMFSLTGFYSPDMIVISLFPEKMNISSQLRWRWNDAQMTARKYDWLRITSEILSTSDEELYYSISVDYTFPLGSIDSFEEIAYSCIKNFISDFKEFQKQNHNNIITNQNYDAPVSLDVSANMAIHNTITTLTDSVSISTASNPNMESDIPMPSIITVGI